jgi:polyferredoxin
VVRLFGKGEGDPADVFCPACFARIEDRAWYLRSPYDAGKRAAERDAARSRKERRDKIWLIVGIAGLVTIFLNYSGWVSSPYEGEPLTPELFIGSLVWIALLFAGFVFLIWLVYRAVVWARHRWP